MQSKFDDTMKPAEATEVLSDKARDAVRVIRQFRSTRSRDPVFRSVRSRPLEARILTQ